jgi:hypothetical protein
VSSTPSTADLSEHQRLLLRATDELHHEQTLSDAMWTQLRRSYDDARLIEFCMLVGHYEMLAMTLNSLQVAPDPALRQRPPAMARRLQRLAGLGRPASRQDVRAS